ncbi:MAG: Dabb family protein [Prevotellamassilia sp.]|nr:Dabb family protein [Prevotellamassilia sp.]MCI6144714.1 Dabb family protein [Bacteroidales bacterium]MDY2623823.1 Dabb family protein [Alloprevotella sp.]MDY4059899.1 Dabb family protein [Alloprevotella sp.]MDY4568700.1 Dabb family protein [Alloprevotella sp.]
MLKHIVMWKFIDGALGQSSQAHAMWMKQHLEALMGVVPEIKQIEVGVNTSKSPMAYDAVLTLVVEDTEALQRYRLHPEHQKISQHCHEVRSSRTVVDYFI